MPQRGTPAKEWLDWDLEYAEWQRNGLRVHVSLQLHNLPHRRWTPETAYDYGKRWGEHFGKTDIRSVEIGNEPWAYPPATYRMIFEHMSRGIRASADYMAIFTCALQASDPAADEGLFKNYVATHLPAAAKDRIDVLNVHAYSYAPDFFHRQRAVPPEDRASTFQEIKNMVRWRDTNLPGTPIWLTEFGYDYRDEWDDCTHPVCVEGWQAEAWSQRMVLLALRWGVEGGYWYFHSDEEKPSGLFTRSGLVKIEGKTARKRTVWRSFERLLEQLGDYRFEAAVHESDELNIYRFSADGGVVKYAIWLPVADQQFKNLRFDPATESFSFCTGCKIDTPNVFRVSGLPIFVKGTR